MNKDVIFFYRLICPSSAKFESELNDFIPDREMLAQSSPNLNIDRNSMVR